MTASLIPGTLAGDVTGDMPVPFWHGMFYPGLINTVAGPSGGGKSTIVARMAADLTLQGKSVIWCPEEDPLVVTYRLRACGADLSKVRFHKFIIPRDLASLRATIIHDDAKLVIFDTAAKHIDAPMQRWGKPLDRLDPICYETGCAVVFIHHTNKNVKKSASPLAALGGSTEGLVGSSRMVHLVGARPDDTSQNVLCPIKNSYGANGDAIAFILDTESFTQSDGTDVEVSHAGIHEKGVKIANPTELAVIQGGGEARGPTPEQLTAAAEWLTKLMVDGPVAISDTHYCKAGHGHYSQDIITCPICNGAMTLEQGAKSLCEDADLSWQGAVKRARKLLEIEISRKGAGKGSVPFMRLPDGHPALTAGAPTVLA